jgi:hypothetical protein
MESNATRMRKPSADRAASSSKALNRSISARRPAAVIEYCCLLWPRSPGTVFLVTHPSVVNRYISG